MVAFSTVNAFQWDVPFQVVILSDFQLSWSGLSLFKLGLLIRFTVIFCLLETLILWTACIYLENSKLYAGLLESHWPLGEQRILLLA